jgi:hypothetical protein
VHIKKACLGRGSFLSSLLPTPGSRHSPSAACSGSLPLMPPRCTRSSLPHSSTCTRAGTLRRSCRLTESDCLHHDGGSGRPFRRLRSFRCGFPHIRAGRLLRCDSSPLYHGHTRLLSFLSRRFAVLRPETPPRLEMLSIILGQYVLNSYISCKIYLQVSSGRSLTQGPQQSPHVLPIFFANPHRMFHVASTDLPASPRQLPPCRAWRGYSASCSWGAPPLSSPSSPSTRASYNWSSLKTM